MDILTLILIIITAIIFLILGLFIGLYKKHREWESKIPSLRQDAIDRSRAVLSGQFSEQIAPILPDFKYNPSDCRFIGKPIDFIIFNGLSNGELKDIVFLEVKSGDSKLNQNQRDLKKIVDDKKVKFEEYRNKK